MSLNYLIAHKDWLLLGCFTVDAINTLISFPLIMWNGPKWVLKSTEPDAKEKIEDAEEAKTVVDLSDTERKSFEVLWEIFSIAYEGYFGYSVQVLASLYETIDEPRPPSLDSVRRSASPCPPEVLECSNKASV